MFSAQDKRALLSVGMPIAGVILISNSWLIPGFLHDFFYDKVLVFLITYWVGLIFSNMYFYMTDDLRRGGMSKKGVAITALIVAFVMLMAAGGPSAIWESPWLVGIGVMPGIDIAWPIAKEWWLTKQVAPAGATVATAEASQPSIDASPVPETPLEPDGDTAS